MRAYLALALVCACITGCSGAGSTTGGSSSLAPSGPAGSTSGSGSTASQRIFTLGPQTLSSYAPFIAWFSESPLSFLNDVAFSCPQPAVLFSVGYTPDFNHVYVVGNAEGFAVINNTVLQFNGTTYSQGPPISLGAVNGKAVAVTPDNSKLYVAVQSAVSNPVVGPPPDLVYVVDVASGKIVKTISLTTSSGTQLMAIASTGSSVYLLSDDALHHNNNAQDVLTRINTSDDSVAYQLRATTLPVEGMRISRDDSTLDMIVNGQYIYAVDAASGSTVATYAIPSQYAAQALDESKTSPDVYVATNVAHNVLMTLDSRSLMLKNTVPINTGLNLSYIAAASSGLVYLDVQPAGTTSVIEAVDPKSGATVGSISKNVGANGIFAQ